MKDFFVSYNKADRQIAVWIAWQLEEVGRSVVIQDWDFRPGSNFVLEMQEAASQSVRTIAVVSPSFLEAEFTQPEWAAAFADDATSNQGKLLLVRVARCEIKGLLKPLIYIDLVDKDETKARQLLLEGIERGRAKPEGPPAYPGAASAPIPDAERTFKQKPHFPGSLPPIHNVSRFRNNDFVGRGDLLEQLHTALRSGRPAAVTQAIQGHGGIGKTQVALEYAYRHAADYQIVWWVRCQTPESRTADFAALAQPLGLPEKDAAEQGLVVTAVRRWLESHGGWLLVLDNVVQPQDIEPLLSHNPTGHTIITTRDPNWSSQATLLKVDLFTPDESVQYLVGINDAQLEPGTGEDSSPTLEVSKEEQSTAEELAEQLGHLPLALAQAKAYIQANQKTIAGYLELFLRRREELWRNEKPPDGYEKTVAETFSLALDGVKQELPTAESLLSLCAFLAPDDIPRWLLEKHVGDELKLDRSLEVLRRYALADVGPEYVSVHRLVQAVCRDRLDDEATSLLAESAVRMVNDALPGNVMTNLQSWPIYDVLSPHAITAVDHFDTLCATRDLSISAVGDTGDEADRITLEAMSRLLDRIATYQQTRAQFASAEPLFRRALAIREQSHGAEHTSVTAILSNLAALLTRTNRLVEAEPLMRRALAIREQSHGAEHASVAAILSNLATLLMDTNRLTEAEPLMRRALAINEQSYGADHPAVATLLNNLAQLLMDTNRSAEAEPLMRRALAIDEESYGVDHPSIAVRLNNLATLLQATNRLAEAEPLMRRALVIDEQSYGADHPSVARDLNNLAQLLQATNRLAEAEPLMRRALAIDEQSHGAEHPMVAIRLNNLAALLQDTNRLAEAEPLMRRHLEIYVRFGKATGHQHPHMQTGIANYRGMLRTIGLSDTEIANRLADAGVTDGDSNPATATS